jgi:hypothetical protein
MFKTHGHSSPPFRVGTRSSGPGILAFSRRDQGKLPPERSEPNGKRSDLAEKLLEILNDLHFDICGRALFEYEFHEKNHFVVHR